jgi:glycosyltransferase involved in cell wall biosynthesis
MGRKLKILMVMNNPGINASAWYRNIIPEKYLEKLGHKVDILGPSFKPIKEFNYDIIVFNRFYTRTFPYLISVARMLGAKIVFELDDLVTMLPKNKAVYEELKKISETAVFLSTVSDLITTTTPELAEEVRKITSRPVEVVPNALDMDFWKKRDGGNKKLRIGYTGSLHHFEDASLILDTIAELQKKHKFTFVIQGINTKTNFEDQEAILNKETKETIKTFKSKLKRIKDREEHDMVSLDDYPEKIRSLNLDIGLCPLADNRFNRSKSALKLYEYTAVGTVSVCSYMKPYKGEALYTAADDQWYEKLEALILDKNLRDDILERQRKWFLYNRVANMVALKWEKIYLDLTKETNGNGTNLTGDNSQIKGSGGESKSKIILS